MKSFFIGKHSYTVKLSPFHITLLLIISVLIGTQSIFGIFYLMKGNQVQAVGNSYYVDGASIGGQCNNNNSGTITQPWCTISYAVSNSSSVAAGDIVYIRAGKYREIAAIGKSGTVNLPITLKNYPGESPVLDGSNQLSNWQNVGGNIYKASVSFSPSGILKNNTPLMELFPFPENIAIENFLINDQWSYNSGYVYINIGANPNQFLIEAVGARNYGVSLNCNKFWVVDGLSIQSFDTSAIYASSTGCGTVSQDYLTIKNNILSYNGYSAILIYWAPGVIINSNIIESSGLQRSYGMYWFHGIRPSQGEAWSVYSGNIYMTPKGSYNSGPQQLWLDGNLQQYNSNAASNPNLLSSDQWTIANNNVYLATVNNPTGHQVYRMISMGDGHGILINTGDRVGRFNITNNTIRNVSSKGMSLCDSFNCPNGVTNGSVIYNNYIYNSGESGFDANYYGVTFSYNNLWNNGIRDTEECPDCGGDKGFKLATNIWGWKIHHNIFHGSGNHDAFLGAANSRIYNNVFLKDTAPLAQPALCGNWGGFSGVLRRSSETTGTDVKIKNNIFMVTGMGIRTECGNRGTLECYNEGGMDCANMIEWNGNNFYTEESDKRYSYKGGGTQMCLLPTQNPTSYCSQDGKNIQQVYQNDNRTDGIFDSLAVDPLFTSQNTNNLNLQTGSPLIDKGVSLTTTRSGGTNTHLIPIYDSLYFHDIDNYQNLTVNEKVKINNQLCTIISVDYAAGNNTITCSESLTFINNEKVYWDYNGSKPDIGVFEVAGLQPIVPADPLLQSSTHPDESAWYNTALVSLSLTSGSGANHYHYLVDQNPSSSLAALANGTQDSDGSFTITIANDGAWYIHIVAHDANNNPSNNYDTYTVYYDHTPPVGATINFTNITSNSIMVNVSGATDAIAGLHVTEPYYFENLSNGNNSGWQTGTTWANSGLSESTSYNYKVKVKDKAGNILEVTGSQSTISGGTNSNSNSNTNTNTNQGGGGGGGGGNNNSNSNSNVNNNSNNNTNQSLPQNPPTPSLQEGRAAKITGASTVYYLSETNHQRYAFPTVDIFNSWYYNFDNKFSNVQTISLSELQAYPLVGNVTMRPGTKLIKIPSDPKVYAVEPGGVIRWVVDENVFNNLGFKFSNVAIMPDIFFQNYTIGSPITSVNNHPKGSLIKYINSPVVYYWDGSVKRPIASEYAFYQNKFYWMYVSTIPSSFVYPTGSDITAKELNLILSW